MKTSEFKNATPFRDGMPMLVLAAVAFLALAVAFAHAI